MRYLAVITGCLPGCRSATVIAGEHRDANFLLADNDHPDEGIGNTVYIDFEPRDVAQAIYTRVMAHHERGGAMPINHTAEDEKK